MHYVVKFLKSVVGENGQHAEICQQLFEIHADSRNAAIESAKAKFCAAHRIADWTLRADRVYAAEAEFPS